MGVPTIGQVMDELDAVNMAISFNPIGENLQTESYQDYDDEEYEQLSVNLIPLMIPTPNANADANPNANNNPDQEGNEMSDEEDASPGPHQEAGHHETGIPNGPQNEVDGPQPNAGHPIVLINNMNNMDNMNPAQINALLQNLNAALQQNGWLNGPGIGAGPGVNDASDSDTDDESGTDDDIEQNPLYVDYNANQQLIDVPIPLPEEKIKEMPVTSFSTTMKYQKCCVCMDEFTETDTVRTLFCNHIYHQGCIDEWFKGHPNCPVCDLDQRNFL